MNSKETNIVDDMIFEGGFIVSDETKRLMIKNGLAEDELTRKK